MNIKKPVKYQIIKMELAGKVAYDVFRDTIFLHGPFNTRKQAKEFIHSLI